MPKFYVEVHGGMFEIEDAIDEDDARDQALDMVEVNIEEDEEEEKK
jgi:hypothetical protein